MRNLHLSESLATFAAKINPFSMKKIAQNASLLPYNTFRMDVKAAIFAEYDNVDELHEILNDPSVAALMQAEKSKGHLPFWHIGSGSNLLFTSDYPGVVLHCKSTGINAVIST